MTAREQLWIDTFFKVDIKDGVDGALDVADKVIARFDAQFPDHAFHNAGIGRGATGLPGAYPWQGTSNVSRTE